MINFCFAEARRRTENSDSSCVCVCLCAYMCVTFLDSRGDHGERSVPGTGGGSGARSTHLSTSVGAHFRMFARSLRRPQSFVGFFHAMQRHCYMYTHAQTWTVPINAFSLLCMLFKAVSAATSFIPLFDRPPVNLFCFYFAFRSLGTASTVLRLPSAPPRDHTKKNTWGR